MDFIKDLKYDYDIIILDPPAFAKHMKARHKAIQGYKRLNARAIEQIKPGGIIFTFSCSQVIGKELFRNTILSAGIAAKKSKKDNLNRASEAAAIATTKLGGAESIPRIN